jgi:hypothetical protein
MIFHLLIVKFLLTLHIIQKLALILLTNFLNQYLFNKLPKNLLRYQYLNSFTVLTQQCCSAKVTFFFYIISLKMETLEYIMMLVQHDLIS